MSNKYDWLGKYNEIVSAYRGESDRATAVLAASFLEHTFAEKLRQFLVDDPDVSSLFKSHGSLSTFSGRIGIAFALGVLTRERKSDLNSIRKIRNHFAHFHAHTTFAEQPVSQWCANLSTAKGIQTQDNGMFRMHEPRDQYLFAIAFSLIDFDRFINAQKQREIPAQTLPT